MAVDILLGSQYRQYTRDEEPRPKRFTSLIAVAVSRESLGHHYNVLPLSILHSFFRYLYVFQILYSLSMLYVKLSV